MLGIPMDIRLATGCRSLMIRGQIWVLYFLWQLTAPSLQLSYPFGFVTSVSSCLCPDSRFSSFSLHLKLIFPRDPFLTSFSNLHCFWAAHPNKELPNILKCSNIVCTVIPNFSPEQQVSIFNCLQVVAVWLTHKSLKLNYVPNSWISLLHCFCKW